MRDFFRIPCGKCTGIPFCHQQTDSGTGILCHFRKKYRNSHKIKCYNECLKTTDAEAGISFIKL